MAKANIITLVFFFMLSQGCSSLNIAKTVEIISLEAYKIGDKWYQPLVQTKGFQEQGVASWYGKKFHGEKTANGEIYDMYKMTAAHKTLPLGTWVLVENLDNGKSIKVRINDRGPFTKNRIIDLSYSAAKRISIIKNGTGEVKIFALGRKKTTKNGETYIHPKHHETKLTVQVGAFSKKEGAEKIKGRITSLGAWKVKISPMKFDGIHIYCVQVGKFKSLTKAIQCKKFLLDNGFRDAFITSKRY